MKFRKKPVVIEATEIRAEWFDWKDEPPADVVIGVVLNPMKRVVEINTLEGVMIGQIGDWIITGVNGEKYPCKPDIFAKTYEPITDEQSAPVPAKEDKFRGSVKALYENIMLNEDTEYDTAESVAVKLGEIMQEHPAPAEDKSLRGKVEEWWDLYCEDSRPGCVAKEELLAIVSRHQPAEVEPLEKLAARKGFMVEQCEVALMTEGYKKYERCYGNSPQEAEQAARQYLEQLPDRKGE